MTDKTDREIMQQALEAIMDAMMVSGGISDKSFEAVKALRERLAQPEQWGIDVFGGDWNKFALAAVAILKETK